MLTHYPYDTLGLANHGWLNARHHFSFANYHNPNRMGFGSLRVINDDVIKAGAGFDTHPHKNMEIITFVREGAITHRDSNGNVGRTEAGDVQVMSAGTGVFHSEFNLESSDTNIFQIWIEPNTLGVEPQWASHEFPPHASQDQLTLLVAGDGSAPLSIHQDAYIYAGHLREGTSLTQKIKHQAYIVVSDGSVKVGDIVLDKGDGLEVQGMSDVTLEATTDTRILVIDVPKNAIS
mgnify:CR=1 FL=1